MYTTTSQQFLINSLTATTIATPFVAGKACAWSSRCNEPLLWNIETAVWVHTMSAAVAVSVLEFGPHRNFGGDIFLALCSMKHQPFRTSNVQRLNPFNSTQVFYVDRNTAACGGSRNKEHQLQNAQQCTHHPKCVLVSK